MREDRDRVELMQDIMETIRNGYVEDRPDQDDELGVTLEENEAFIKTYRLESDSLTVYETMGDDLTMYETGNPDAHILTDTYDDLDDVR